MATTKTFLQLKTYFILFALSALTFGYDSCSNDDKNGTTSQAINKTVEIEYGRFLDLSIGNGMGNYIVETSNAEIATAVIDSNVVKIKAISEGMAVLTIIDKNKRKLNVAVKVIPFDEVDFAPEITDNSPMKKNEVKIITKDI